MIAEFVAAWPLFQWAWIAGWVLSVLLGTIGVVVVARDQIFIGAAVSQASMLGVALGLVLVDAVGVHAGGDDAWLHASAVGASVVAALLTTGGGEGEASHEALTGWVFLAAGSLAILVVARSPHGLEEVHRLLSSSIIGASATDVVMLGLLALVTGAGLLRLARPLVLVALDPAMAAVVGMRLGRWQAGISCWLGLVIGLAMPVAGALYTFGGLVLPALVARNLCREVQPMFLVAPLVALAASGAGFVVAHDADLPPAQLTVALLCALVVLSSVGRRLRKP